MTNLWRRRQTLYISLRKIGQSELFGRCTPEGKERFFEQQAGGGSVLLDRK